jgi:hypothetical protein
LKYISWIGYGNEALLVNQWDGVTGIKCTDSAATCPPNGLTGEDVLNVFEMEKV